MRITISDESLLPDLLSFLRPSTAATRPRRRDGDELTYSESSAWLRGVAIPPVTSRPVGLERARYRYGVPATAKRER